MQTTFDLPPSLPEDLERLKIETERFKRGEISATQYRSFRVPQGVYEQRQSGLHMLRVRFPGGGILPHQLRALAEVSRTYGNGVLHVTTRQDVQVHDVPLDNIHPALVRLYAAGLSTRGGGGNTVRNITACYAAGVCAKEAFNVTPYATALTQFLLPDPLSYQLPRKYKIAFSGCSEDCIGATVNDVGFIAKRRDGVDGFTVYVGGGLGAHSRVADLLEPFIPATEAHLVAEAVKRVFDQHGNRRNRHRARLRFLIERIGMERFRALYEEELAHLRQEALPPLKPREIPAQLRQSEVTAVPPQEGFERWRAKNVEPQKQEGYFLVHIPLFLGDIPADTLEKLAEVIEQHGEGVLYSTHFQNLALRWVREEELTAVHQKLSRLGLAESPPPLLRDLVSCTGASTCRLGVCLSRGLASAIRNKLMTSSLDLEALEGFHLNINGCPNACGRHAIAQLGFAGAARRVGSHLAPYYQVVLGGRVAEGETRLAEAKGTLPARNVPDFTVDFLRAFQESPEYPNYDAFLEARGEQIAAQLIARYKPVPSFEEDKNYYFDWGAETLFSLAERGPGECGAGVFDLIEVDLKSAHEALEQNHLYAATALAARALLVTQGQEAREDREALELFDRYFITSGLVPEDLRTIVQEGRRVASAPNPEEAFTAEAAQVAQLVETVQRLYDTMDDSLRFRPVDLNQISPTEPETPEAKEPEAPKAEESEPEEPEAPSQITPDREVDFRGVVCPLNYVKTKLVLEQMQSGQVLAILLDEEGARNVPESARLDGHEPLSVTQQDGHWRVLIRKG